MPDGARVTYLLEDGANWEIGEGVYTTSGTTLTRNVRLSSNSNALITLSGAAFAMIVASSDDIKEIHPGYVSGRWYLPLYSNGNGTGGPPGATTLRMLPFTIRSRVTISDLASHIPGGSAGGLFQAGIYASDPATKKPIGDPVAKTASLSTTTATTVSGPIVGGNVTLQPGLHWMGVLVDNGTAVFRSVGVNSDVRFNVLHGSTTLANAASTGGFALTFNTATTYGTWPTLTSGSSFTESASNFHAFVMFRVA